MRAKALMLVSGILCVAAGGLGSKALLGFPKAFLANPNVFLGKILEKFGTVALPQRIAQRSAGPLIYWDN